MKTEWKAIVDKTPEDTAKRIISQMFASMDDNLRFKDHGYDTKVYIVDEALRAWKTRRAFLDWVSNNVKEENQERCINEFKSLVEGVDKLVEKAGDDEIVWDSLTMVIEILTQNDQPLPEPLSDLAVKAMRGEIKRPTKRGRRANTDRDMVIQLAVLEIIKRFPEVTATRNEASNGESSACEIVADALAESNIFLSPRSVEKVWEKGNPGFGFKKAR